MVMKMAGLPRRIDACGKTMTMDQLGVLDLQALLAMERRSHSTPWSAANFESSLNSHVCVGLESDGNWVAYAILSFVVGEGELLLFVVDKPWQGRGLGRVFLGQLISLCRARASTLFLEVRASNSPAINLYEGQGFNQVGIRPNYYPAARGAREDAWLYALELDESMLFSQPL